MPLPAKSRLALTAIAATAASAGMASPALGATRPVPGASQGTATAAAQLSFGPSVKPTPGATSPGDYTITFTGPGCVAGGGCTDTAVPSTATWSLDYQDSAPGSAVTNITVGKGNTVTGPYRVTFPAPPANQDGTWKVSITFTTGTQSWSSSVLVDHGSAGLAPTGPAWVWTDRQDVPAGQAATFSAQASHVASGSGQWQLVFDFGDGTPRQTVAVTPPTSAGAYDLTTTTHVYAKPGTYTAYVAATDGVNRAAWTPVSVIVTAAAASLTVTPNSGGGSTANPLTVTLDASASKPGPGATIKTYAFDCGATGVTAVPDPHQPSKATCTYATPGAYHVGVTVTDSAGSVSHALPQTVNVGAGYAAPAIVAFDIAQDFTAPLTAYADLSSVHLDPAADPTKATFTIDWGDGKQDTYTKATLPPNSRVTHAYATSGIYNTGLSVDDGLGQAGSKQSAAVRITIVPVPPGPTPVARASGVNRYDTGVIVSRKRWADAADTAAPAFRRPDAIVLATGAGFSDALAGVPLSVKVNGGLLLTEPGTLTPAVRDEIRRILPADAGHVVYLLGGNTAISPAVSSALVQMGYTVTRVSGPDRYATALAIAHQMGDPAHAVVARGDDFADALSAGPFAADLFGTGSGANYVPAAIVLSNDGQLDPATEAYLHSRYATPGLSVVAVGGGAARAVTTVLGFDGTSVARNTGEVLGLDRYDTARRVAAVFGDVDPNAPIGVATGTAFADALTGGAFMASAGGPLLLTDPHGPSPAMTDAVRRRAQTVCGLYVFGGPGALAPAVFDSLVSDVQGVAQRF